MIDLNEIHSLSEFQRNTKRHMEQLKKTGRPQVLTVNGKAEIIVQDAAAYQKLIELLDQAEAIVGIREGLESMHAGKGVALSKADAKLRKKHKISKA